VRSGRCRGQQAKADLQRTGGRQCLLTEQVTLGLKAGRTSDLFSITSPRSTSADRNQYLKFKVFTPPACKGEQQLAELSMLPDTALGTLPPWLQSWVPVAHARNPSYSGGTDQEDCGSKPQRKIVGKTLSQKKTLHEEGLMEWLKV
jgi:hypothetical protein